MPFFKSNTYNIRVEGRSCLQFHQSAIQVFYNTKTTMPVALKKIQIEKTRAKPIEVAAINRNCRSELADTKTNSIITHIYGRDCHLHRSPTGT